MVGKNVVFVLFSVFSVFLLCSGLVFAQTGTVGVNEGDWFTYGFSFDFYSEDSEMEMPEDVPFGYLAEGEVIRFDVLGVSGSNVSGQFSVNYENGTQEVITGWVDVATGEGEFANWLISSGLDAGDFVYPSMMDEMINETVMLETSAGMIETSHIEYSMGEPVGDTYYVFGVNIYWDRQTGVLVEMSFESEMMLLGNLTTASGGWKLTGSNITTIPEFFAPALITTFVATTVAVFVIKKANLMQIK
ncbi:MAG: hypothetical protein QCH99_01825 [Candidatus Bathyarchaeota archaeon]|nr:hypothetical protein [Candidatus Bathyarchaeum tardum]WGM89221.1 MAG: hypothetical protein NUK63_09960 [Candidatus Bathyarchaeum tardum]